MVSFNTKTNTKGTCNYPQDLTEIQSVLKKWYLMEKS